MRIILSGGGTGGHITPLLAVAQALKSSDNELHYIGEGTDQESALLAGSSLSTHTIMAGKFRRYHGESWQRHLLDVKTIALNIRDGFKVIIGLTQSLFLLRRLKPAAVFIKGGYVGLPVGLAAAFLNIPLIIHESDAALGLTNRILQRFATVKAAGFPIDSFSHTGNPIREELLQASKEAGYEFFKVSPEQPIILVIGGSSGARVINQTVRRSLSQLKSYQLIHVTGSKDFDNFNGLNRRVYAFLGKELGNALRIADVVISRAGANTLAELAAFGKAAIIIPHPHVTGGHQLANAQKLAQEGAVRLIPQSELTPERLLEEIDLILHNKSIRNQLEQKIQRYAQPEAAQKLAKLIVQSL